jgi:hypothetical protein
MTDDKIAPGQLRRWASSSDTDFFIVIDVYDYEEGSQQITVAKIMEYNDVYDRMPVSGLLNASIYVQDL